MSEVKDELGSVVLAALLFRPFPGFRELAFCYCKIYHVYRCVEITSRKTVNPQQLP